MQQYYLSIQQDADVVELYAKELQDQTAITLDNETSFVEEVLDAPQPQLAVPMKVCWSNIQGPWNQELAEKFRETFLQRYPCYNNYRLMVVEEFFVRLKRQKALLSRTGHLTQDPNQFALYAEAIAIKDRKRCRATERRVLVSVSFHCRRALIHLELHRVHLKTVEQQESESIRKDNWKLLKYVINMLGPQGQSSDDSPPESDTECAYPIRERAWRNEEITRLLKMIDDHRSFGTVYRNQKPGQRPHKRVRIVGPISKWRAICGLPHNFY